MVVLVDMDDTIENLAESWINWLNVHHSTSVRYESVDSWDIDSFFPELTHEQVHAPLRDKDFWKTVRPLPGAQEYLKKIIDDGDELYIVTATHYASIEPKFREVILKYFPFIKYNRFIITSNKQLVRGDVLIDDGPHNLIGGKYQKILMSANHNRKFNAEEHGMCRVENWAEAYLALQKMKSMYARVAQ